MSEAESGAQKVETQAGSETEQLDSATESKANAADTATETVTKIKKVATPRQLEALGLARVKKNEKSCNSKGSVCETCRKDKRGTGE